MIHIYRLFSCIFPGKTYTTAMSLISLRAHSGPLSEPSSTSRLRSSSICCGWPSGRRISVQNPCWLMISWGIISVNILGIRICQERQPGLNGMIEGYRTAHMILPLLNGDSLGMWVCHHAINHPWLGMFFWHLFVVMWGMVFDVGDGFRRAATLLGTGSYSIV